MQLSMYPTIDIRKKNCTENKIVSEDDASVEIFLAHLFFLSEENRLMQLV